jgi:hypothetical protein
MVALALPGHAASHNSGSGTTSCADGTVTWCPKVLWAPNHKMQTITINYVAPADDSGDTTTITVGPITDNQVGTDGTEMVGSGQPTDQQGADWDGTGNTATSAEGSVATTTASVRAERSGTDQAGRTYSIQVACSEKDKNGVMVPADSDTATLTVAVPHDQGKN